MVWLIPTLPCAVRPYQIDFMFHGSSRVFFLKIEKKEVKMQLICTRNPVLTSLVLRPSRVRRRTREGLETRLSTHNVARMEDDKQFCVAERI